MEWDILPNPKDSENITNKGFLNPLFFFHRNLIPRELVYKATTFRKLGQYLSEADKERKAKQKRFLCPVQISAWKPIQKVISPPDASRKYCLEERMEMSEVI